MISVIKLKLLIRVNLVKQRHYPKEHIPLIYHRLLQIQRRKIVHKKPIGTNASGYRAGKPGRERPAGRSAGKS